MKMLFWNTHRNSNINSFILELVEQNEIDILILSEYAGNLEELSKYLMQSKKDCVSGIQVVVIEYKYGAIM